MLALALGGFGIGTTEFVAMGLLPEMASGLGVSEPIAGHVISAYALGVVVGAPLIAALTARVPRRTLLIALMVAFTVGNAASVFAPSYTTLMMARFVAGLPHGAYFGVAALVAAHLAEPGKRAKAVAMVMMGLSVANVIGVPVAAWIGQALGWRSAFALVAVIGVATVASLFVWIPRLDGMPVTNPITELGALGRVQVWMTLIVGMVRIRRDVCRLHLHQYDAHRRVRAWRFVHSPRTHALRAGHGGRQLRRWIPRGSRIDERACSCRWDPSL